MNQHWAARETWRATRCATQSTTFGLAVLGLLAPMASAQTAPPEAPRVAPLKLPAFSAMAPGEVAPPWRVVGLPRNKAPLTRFEVVPLGNATVLRATTNASYGALTFDVPKITLGPDSTLSWRWQLLRALPQADLRTKQGDDAPIKLCLLFDLPLERLSWSDRTLMRLARSASGEALPSATLCYTWDHRLPADTLLPNAYTNRVRTLVLQSGDGALGQWFTHTRSIRQDFLRAFGAEASELPPLQAVVVGADSDNTGGQSEALLGDVTLQP